LDFKYPSWIYLHVWVRYDDTPALYQLQASVGRSFELEDSNLQIYQHVYWYVM